MRLKFGLGLLSVFIVWSTKTGETVCKSPKHESLSILAVRRKYPPIRLFANMRCGDEFTEEEIRASEARHLGRIISAFRSKKENKK